MTVKTLINRLQSIQNQDAVVVVCAEGVEYCEVSSVKDETQPADKDGVIGNALILSAQLNKVISNLDP